MKSLYKYCQVTFIFLVACVYVCQAQTTYYVATNGVDSRTGLDDWTNAVATISNGVAKATSAGDTVLVSNGTYLLTTNVSINLGITLRGFNGRDVTIINAGYPDVSNRCVFLDKTNAVVEGFTLTGGFMTNTAFDNNGYGGGAYVNYGILRDCIVSNNTGVMGGGVFNRYGTISNCVICYNTSWGMGGGLTIYNSDGQAYNCSIFCNLATNGYGGGGYLANTGMLLANCMVSNNNADGYGGGIYGYKPVISNCVIAGNRVSRLYGGGISLLSGPLTHGAVIVDCIISNNSDWGVYSENIGMTIRNSTISGNTTGGIQQIGANSTFLTNCVISNNMGRGIYVYTGSITAIWCRIVGNTSGDKYFAGAGIYVNGSCVLDHCVIEGNSVSCEPYVHGGGLCLRAGSIGNIRNCLIASNRAESTVSGAAYGGGIDIEANATNSFSSCTIVGNFATYRGGGVYLAEDGGDTFTDCVIATNRLAAANNDLYLPTSARSNAFYYSCGNVLTNTLQGNITNAPVFVDALAGNWRLAASSPCINAGTNESWMSGAVDLDEHSRIDRWSGIVDMGCYENLFSGTMFSFH